MKGVRGKTREKVLLYPEDEDGGFFDMLIPIYETSDLIENLK